MENCEAMMYHELTYLHIISTVQEMFRWKLRKFKISYHPYFQLSDLLQMFAVLFEICYSFNWINFKNLNWISPKSLKFTKLTINQSVCRWFHLYQDESKSRIESSRKPEGGPTTECYDVCFICTSDMYGTGSTEHGESSELTPRSMVHDITREELEQIHNLKSMIKRRGWSMATSADLALGQSLESAIADMIGRSGHVIVFINDTDCTSCERRRMWRALSPNSFPQILDNVIRTREIKSRLIPVISCKWSSFLQTFSRFATFTAVHIKDLKLEERLVKSIDIRKSEIMERSGKDKTGIYYVVLNFKETNWNI